jgi:tetratricopeptide (TPR) repeat protein
VAAVTLLGYGGFSLTDWQLDIPIFAIALAMFAARCASPEEGDALRDGSRYRRAVGIVAFLALAVVALLGRADPAPEMNTRALALARDPAQTDRAIALLRASLALNADQEIAHFNLGWLLLVRDPKGAERHFRAAARLVPDKGGVYFGLGLAQLNQGGAPRAARAFALECLNDPAFMASPWWREPAIAAVRDRTESAFRQLATRARALVPGHAEQLASLEKTATQLGRAVAGPERVYPRERTGYPVLMRNLNLAPPLDLYDVRELQSPPPWCASLPPKGWLPSPALLRLLDEPAPPKT